MVFVQWHQDDLVVHHIEPDHPEWDEYQDGSDKAKVKPQAPNDEKETVTPDQPKMRIQEKGGEQYLTKDRHDTMRQQADEHEKEQRSIKKWKRILGPANGKTDWVDAVKREMEALQEVTIFGAHSAGAYNSKYEHE